jgi:hypothetical protein
VLCHKGFHRYTARKKQGGDQLAADARGKAHKSAGANMRRANAQRLVEDIKDTIKEVLTSMLTSIYTAIVALT